MQIRIYKHNKNNLKSFLNKFIVPRFLNTIRAKFNRDLVENYAKLFDSKEFFNLFLTSNFLRVREINGEYFQVDINPNLKLSDGTLFIDCCKTINFGSLSISSYPIFDACFRVFQQDFWVYYRFYGGMY